MNGDGSLEENMLTYAVGAKGFPTLSYDVYLKLNCRKGPLCVLLYSWLVAVVVGSVSSDVFNVDSSHPTDSFQSDRVGYSVT